MAPASVSAGVPEVSMVTADGQGSAVTAMAAYLRLPRKITTILEGEGLLNDVTALVAYRFAVAASTCGCRLHPIGWLRSIPSKTASRFRRSGPAGKSGNWTLFPCWNKGFTSGRRIRALD